jgi:hypothetical protein
MKLSSVQVVRSYLGQWRRSWVAGTFEHRRKSGRSSVLLQAYCRKCLQLKRGQREGEGEGDPELGLMRGSGLRRTFPWLLILSAQLVSRFNEAKWRVLGGAKFS